MSANCDSSICQCGQRPGVATMISHVARYLCLKAHVEFQAVHENTLSQAKHMKSELIQHTTQVSILINVLIPQGSASQA
jgi:hypothetical protein